MSVMARRKKRKTSKFEREDLKKQIAKAKEVRAFYDDRLTDKDCNEPEKKYFGEMSEMLTTAIEAMKTILYDL